MKDLRITYFGRMQFIPNFIILKNIDKTTKTVRLSIMTKLNNLHHQYSSRVMLIQIPTLPFKDVAELKLGQILIIHNSCIHFI